MWAFLSWAASYNVKYSRRGSGLPVVAASSVWQESWLFKDTGLCLRSQSQELFQGHRSWCLGSGTQRHLDPFDIFFKGCYLWHQNVAPARVQMGEDSWRSKGIANQKKYSNERMFAEVKTVKQNH